MGKQNRFSDKSIFNIKWTFLALSLSETIYLKKCKQKSLDCNISKEFKICLSHHHSTENVMTRYFFIFIFKAHFLKVRPKIIWVENQNFFLIFIIFWWSILRHFKSGLCCNTFKHPCLNKFYFKQNWEKCFKKQWQE